VIKCSSRSEWAVGIGHYLGLLVTSLHTNLKNAENIDSKVKHVLTNFEVKFTHKQGTGHHYLSQDGNRSSFRNILFLRNIRQRTKSKNMILSSPMNTPFQSCSYR
jgi:hypothetical protein